MFSIDCTLSYENMGGGGIGGEGASGLSHCSFASGGMRNAIALSRMAAATASLTSESLRLWSVMLSKSACAGSGFSSLLYSP